MEGSQTVRRRTTEVQGSWNEASLLDPTHGAKSAAERRRLPQGMEEEARGEEDEGEHNSDDGGGYHCGVGDRNHKKGGRGPSPPDEEGRPGGSLGQQ